MLFLSRAVKMLLLCTLYPHAFVVMPVVPMMADQLDDDAPADSVAANGTSPSYDSAFNAFSFLEEDAEEVSYYDTRCKWIKHVAR